MELNSILFRVQIILNDDLLSSSAERRNYSFSLLSGRSFFSQSPSRILPNLITFHNIRSPEADAKVKRVLINSFTRNVVFSMFVGTEREREREVEKLFKFTS